MNRVRKNFAKTAQTIEPPHLIAMQRYSYDRFLQRDVSPDAREDVGLQAIFKNIFPITDFNGLCSLEFVRYTFGDPKYTVEECIERGMTYEVPVKITDRVLARRRERSRSFVDRYARSRSTGTTSRNAV